jgi:hypothetical protein
MAALSQTAHEMKESWGEGHTAYSEALPLHMPGTVEENHRLCYTTLCDERKNVILDMGSCNLTFNQKFVE